MRWPAIITIITFFTSINLLIAEDNVDTINSTYTQDYCHQLELAYGNNMMSEGGSNAFDKMFHNIELDHKKVLDFGSGLGGVAFHLAKKYNTQVIGVEVNQEMIDSAFSRRPKELESLVDFQLIYGDQSLPFPDETFDVVYSKGVIVHLPQDQRNKAFSELHRVLIKGGKIIIHDWLSPSDGVWSKEIQDLIESESLPLFAHSPKSYQKDLENHGFKNVAFSDFSLEYASYNQDVVNRLNSAKIKRQFINAYGEETYKEHIEGYKNIRDVNKQGKLVSAYFVSEK